MECNVCERRLAEMKRKEEMNQDLRLQVVKLNQLVQSLRKPKSFHIFCEKYFPCSVPECGLAPNKKNASTSVNNTFLLTSSSDNMAKPQLVELKSVFTQTSCDTNSVHTQTEIEVSVEETVSTGSKIETSSNGTIDNGYVYDENSKLYYNYSTGFYFDQEKGVFFDSNSGINYVYNYSNGKYQAISTEDSETLDTLEGACEKVVDQENLNSSDNVIAQSDMPILKQVYHNDEATSFQVMKIEDDVSSFQVTKVEDLELNDSVSASNDWLLPSGENVTVTDLVKEIVEQNTGMSDYIYDHSCSMYYSQSTGCYFDSVNQLLYDPSKSAVYTYDTEKQSYEFYGYYDNTVSEEPTIDLKKQKARNSFWKKKLKQGNKNECKTVENLDIVDEFSSPEEGEIFSSESEAENIGDSCDVYPPCIRAIVERSEKLQIGSLLMITYQGGIIGRDESCFVHLPDSNVSKTHAEVQYDSESMKYSIKDNGSQNGTFINDKRLSEPKEESDYVCINHGDQLSFGTCQLLLHIHPGSETCDKCEPGQVLAKISAAETKPIVFLNKKSKDKIRREMQQQLKMKYGLKGMQYTSNSKSTVQKGYEDKAELRRQTVGSDNPHEKVVESSLNVAMSSSNKGYKMLQSMGWKEGQTLGNHNVGILEPIPLTPWTSKAGLGSTSEVPVMDQQSSKKNKKWVKAQERYLKLQSF